MILQGKLLALVIAAVVAACVASFFAGYTVRGWKEDAERLKAVTEVEKQRDLAQTALDIKSKELEDALADLRNKEFVGRSVIREIYRDIPAPPAECAAPPAARSLLIEAGARGGGEAVGEPSGAVPGPAGTP